MRALRLFSVVALVWAGPLAAQSGKRPLTQADWDVWRSIAGATLSNDGRWALYTLVPQVGDGDLVVRATEGTTEYRLPRGFVGRPRLVVGRGGGPGGDGDGEASVAPAQFTADSRFAVTLTYAPMAEFERARIERRRPADHPRATLAIMDLATGQVTTVERVRSFQVPRDNGTWLAYLLEPAAEAARPAARDTGSAATTRRREYGSTLVLRNLATGAERRFDDVASYVFTDSARHLGLTVSSRTPERDGAYVIALADGREVPLLTGRGEYRQFAFDESGTQAAFLSNRDEQDRSEPRFALYHAALRGAAPTAQRVIAAGALPDEMLVSSAGRVAFTKPGTAILFGMAPLPLDSLPADSLSERAVVDIWHWQDPRLQPQQRLDAGRERNRSFQAIYHLNNRRIVQLANDSMPNVSLSEDGRVALAATSERYSIERMWGDAGNDVWVIDATTGSRRLIREKISSNAQLSPSGRFVAFFDRGHWYAHSVANGRTVNLTEAAAGVRFDQETRDVPGIPGPWGTAGWTRGDRGLLVYDRYDLWELDPTGTRRPVMVTDSVGRREQMVLRLVNMDREERYIDPAEPLLLRAFHDSSKASGFYRDRLGVVQRPERIVMADANFGMPQKARNADRFLVTRGTFVDFPNLHTGTSLASLTRISDANPQQREYVWGAVELVNWVSTDGVPLQGLLYKPENFDPSKTYPMVTYFYERVSNNRHNYVAPFGRNIINATHYVSNGYLVFMPDIHYEIGYPGPSAMKSVVPGVQILLQRPYVDRNALGLNGQSWGGYQIAYMITQTQMFRAAMAGAPVSNMTSAYGGIRWGSGLARPFQYEVGQSRIGGSLWEYPLRYIENSPLFWADKITTPLLMMHNDQDDAVPWYQGIEMFVALRRLQKEVYLLNYNEDRHNPTTRTNQKDVARRMEEFFDHHLRGYPAPDWMRTGIPYREKGRDQIRPVIQAGETRAGSSEP